MTIFDLFHPTPRADTDAADRTGAVQRDALGRLTLYRKAFRGAAITCPAEVLWQPDVAAAVKKHGHTVDVHSYGELDFALSLGIPAARIVVHDDGRTAAPVRCAVNAGVGRIVIGCSGQVKVLASSVNRSQRVLIDVTTEGADATVAAVFACRRLDLIGLHARLTPTADLVDYTVSVAQMVIRMARIRREHDVILSRVSLAGGDALSGATVGVGELRTLAAALDDIFDDVCARCRFPRPALILTPW